MHLRRLVEPLAPGCGTPNSPRPRHLCRPTTISRAGASTALRDSRTTPPEDAKAAQEPRTSPMTRDPYRSREPPPGNRPTQHPRCNRGLASLDWGKWPAAPKARLDLLYTGRGASARLRSAQLSGSIGTASSTISPPWYPIRVDRASRLLTLTGRTPGVGLTARM